MFDSTPVGRLKPSFAWLEPVMGGKTPGAGVTICVCVFAASVTALNLDYQYVIKYYDFEHALQWRAAFPNMLFTIIACLSKYQVLVLQLC